MPRVMSQVKHRTRKQENIKIWSEERRNGREGTNGENDNKKGDGWL